MSQNSTPKKRSRSSSRGPVGRPKSFEELSPCSSPARDEFTKKHKLATIKRVLNSDPVDVDTLRQLAISRGGLLSDELRIQAWPKLLSVDVDNIPSKPDTEVLHGHRDYEQVVLDVNRSIKRFPPGMLEETRLAVQDQLVDVIMRVLVANPELHYYQGYHDITVTFLLVAGEDITFAVMNNLSQNHLRDFMDKSMDRTKHMLFYLYPILGKSKPKVKEYMERAEVGTIFCLSWLITWYGHVLSDFRSIVRLYDYFIACHPLMPIYVAAAIVLYRQEEVLACECEMPFIHSLLSKIPNDLPFEQLASHAGDLFCQFPPKDLAEEAEKLYNDSLIANNIQKSQNAAYNERLKRMQLAKNRKFRLLRLLKRATIWTVMGAIGAAVLAIYIPALGWGSVSGEGSGDL